MRVLLFAFMLLVLPFSGKQVYASEIDIVDINDFESESYDENFVENVSISDNTTREDIRESGQDILLLQSISDCLELVIETQTRLLIVIAFLLSVIGGCSIANLIIHWSIR